MPRKREFYYQICPDLGRFQRGGGDHSDWLVQYVDLKSEDEIHLRSLDNIVINNVNMETSGMGADFIHLIAANELQVNNLYFSDTVKQIAMEAMTINLSHVNFPLNSVVNLRSLYGGVDGKYPNFNTVMYGRVNFIEQIKYGNQLIMDRASFDANGGNITIGAGNWSRAQLNYLSSFCLQLCLGKQ